MLEKPIVYSYVTRNDKAFKKLRIGITEKYMHLSSQIKEILMFLMGSGCYRTHLGSCLN